MKLFIIIFFCLVTFFANAQHKEVPGEKDVSYIGKYEASGMIVQVTRINKTLVLLVPGAPLQKLTPVGGNKFKTDAFSDEIFVFVKQHGKIASMISQRSGQSLELRKISDIPDDCNKADSLLLLKKSTPHFSFLYSKTDSISINKIAEKLEANYSRILADLKVKKIPVTIVRIYPDLVSFHQGINFPGAPDNILATAFGKDDIRMVSPNCAGVDSSMLMQGLTHEFTHCVHLNIDYSPNNPRWLWEGIAMFESGWFFDPKEIDIIKTKNYPPLAALNNGMEYMLGYVIIEAIKDIWGFNTVIDLIKKRGDVPTVLKINQNQFEERIYQNIHARYIANK